MRNKDIRRQIEEAGLRYWMVAEQIGIHPGSLCLWLRHDLEGERLRRVQKAVDELTRQQEVQNRV